MPQLVWFTGPDGAVEFFNQRWHDYTGLSKGEALKWGWQMATHPDDLPILVSRWKHALASGEPLESEFRLRASDGSYRWYLARGRPLRDAEGKIVRWVGTTTDIEDQKQARHQLERGIAARTAEVAAAQEQLQMVLDGATNVSIIAANTRGIITVFNSGAENMLGYTSGEMVGKQKPTLFHVESEVIARGLQLTKETGRQVRGLCVFGEGPSRGVPEDREWTYVRKDGSHLTVALVVTALTDAHGSIAGFLGVAMDVSARKKAEVASRASDERFRLIVEAIEDYALIMLDTSGHVISWNIGAERIKGYKAEEIIGRHFSCFYSAADVEDGRAESALRIAATQGRYTEEGSLVRKDGSSFLADVVIAAIHDDAGKLRGFAKVIHDITERKFVERQMGERSAQLEAANQKLNVLVRRLGLATDALQAGVWDWDIQTNIIAWDERMYQIYGIPSNTPVHYQLWADTVVPDDLPAREAVLQTTIATKSQGSCQFRIKLPNGSIRYIQAAEGAILDDTGKVVSVIGINIDTTERKFNEDLERQVDERTAELKVANRELEEFAYAASHDLKAPLRVIDNASKWLEEDLQEHLTDDTRETLMLLRGRVRRMDKLLEDLLEYARIGRATDDRYEEIIAGDVLIDNVLALLSPEGFTLRVSPVFAGIQIPKMPLQQIFLNLIGNAIKHHHRKEGCVEVTVEDDGLHYAFAVKDDGPGIPAEFHEQIFKMFQTLRPRDQVEGSGMGLALARKSIEVFGGALTLQSSEGQGSTFGFTWPKQQEIRNRKKEDDYALSAQRKTA